MEFCYEKAEQIPERGELPGLEEHLNRLVGIAALAVACILCSGEAVISKHPQLTTDRSVGKISSIDIRMFGGHIVKNTADAVFFPRLFVSQASQSSLYRRAKSDIWLAILPASKCLRNGDLYGKKKYQKGNIAGSAGTVLDKWI